MERSSRRLVAAPKSERGGERADPVITYTRLTDDASGRVEPRFAASVSRDPTVEDLELLPQVEAPPSQAAIDIDELAEPVARGRAGRRRTPRAVVLAGFLALVGGAGVLAATYGGVISLDTRSAAVPVPVSTVVHAGGVADATATAPAEAGPGVRVIASAGSPIPDAGNAPAVAVPAPGNTSDAAMVDTAGPVIVDPPQPRLRPATASYSPPQTGDSGDGMVAPATAAAADPALTPSIGATATVPVPVAPAGSDFDMALASVDRILDQQALAAGTPTTVVPTAALPYPVLEPLPGASDPYATNGTAAYPAYPAPNAYPQTAYPAEPGYLVYGPPAPPGMDLAADDTSGSLLPRRRVFLVPNAPVPPADIPNAQISVWGN